MPAESDRSPADFPDWLGPMLVKELRQLLRSRVFTGALMWVQFSSAVLVLLEVVSSVEAHRNGGGQPMGMIRAAIGEDAVVTGLYWGNLVLLLHLLLPFRHLFFSDEDSQFENMELLRLAGLADTNLALSKSLAHGALSFLLLTSLLPYAVVRYFVGGVNVTSELGTLIWLWVNGLVFGTLGVLIGSCRRGGRIGWAIGLLFIFPVGEVICWSVVADGFTVGYSNPTPYIIWIGGATIMVSLSLTLAYNVTGRARSILLIND